MLVPRLPGSHQSGALHLTRWSSSSLVAQPGKLSSAHRHSPALLDPAHAVALYAAAFTSVADQPAAATAPAPAPGSGLQAGRAAAAAAAAAAGAVAATGVVQQQGRQQAPSSSTRGSQQRPAARRKLVKPKPFLVRVAGRTSKVSATAGAVVKRLQTENMVRVAAIDAESLPKALIVLTAANNMAQANSGHMLVFQPTAISSAAAAEPPRVPVGSMVMYTTQIMAGEVLTFNTLRVTTTTEPKALSKAIIARLATNSHTVMECYGTQALTAAVQAIAQARKGLLIRGQDCACIITSTRKAISTDTAAAAAGAVAAEAAGAPGAVSFKYPATCHRLVLVECEPRNPRALLMRSTVGVSDRVAAVQVQGTAAAAPEPVPVVAAQ